VVWYRHRERRRKKYSSSGDDSDANKATQDNAEPLDDVDTTSTPACQRLIIHNNDDRLDDTRTSPQARRYSRCVEKPSDAAVWKDQLLPPPPPPPSRGLLPTAVARREFIETSF